MSELDYDKIRISYPEDTSKMVTGNLLIYERRDANFPATINHFAVVHAEYDC